jgi:hypothetical protein
MRKVLMASIAAVFTFCTLQMVSTGPAGAKTKTKPTAHSAKKHKSKKHIAHKHRRKHAAYTAKSKQVK